jgi:hypothetical protein
MNIVELWSWIFDKLRWLSIFQITTKLYPKLSNRVFVEWWVLGNLIASIIALWSISYSNIKPLEYFFLGYGVVRIFEIFVYQVNVLIFDEYRATKKNVKYSLHSYRRVVILLLHNFVEIIFWFAASYGVLMSDYKFVPSSTATFFELLYMSFVTMTTFGQPNFTFLSRTGMMLILFQSIVGVFMTLITLARFIGLLPRPHTKDETEQEK